MTIRPKKPDHLVKRDNWTQYGDPDVFNKEFSNFVEFAKDKIIGKKITSEELINEAINKRQSIECLRNNEEQDLFGIRRYDQQSMKRYKRPYLRTPLFTKNYSCGKERAIKLTHNECFIKQQTKAGSGLFDYIKSYRFDDSYIENINYGVIVGKAGDRKINLTQILTSPKVKKMEMEVFFGRDDEYYDGEDKRSAILVHTDADQLEPGLKHVQGLIDLAMAGDLSAIPRIHWWYVQLAPTVRGPGGTVEMIIHALCAARGYYLPGWAKDISPSIEVLVQPNEDAFCQQYHKLFETHQDELQMLFKGKN